MRYYTSGFNRMASDIPGEVIVGALVLSLIFGGVAGKINYDHAGRTQVAFSERGKTAKAAEREGKEVPPLTHFYSVNNDATMIVLEAKNIANETNRGPVAFAKELETITDSAYRVHRQSGEYAVMVPPAADKALASLDHLTRAAGDLPPIIQELENSWSESHQDYYRTEKTEHQVCDRDGQNCHVEVEEHQVYDHSVHSYSFYPRRAENADRLTGAFLRNHPDLSVAEQLQRAASTEADNEYIIEKSIYNGKMMMQEDLLKEANKWADGSNLTVYREDIVASRKDLQSIAPQFSASRRTARSQSYITYSSSDSGPKELQIAGTMRGHASRIYYDIHKIVDGISFSRDAVPLLDRKIRQLIAVALDGEAGDAKALQKEIMKIARENYDRNYEGGLDVNPFKWEQVLLAALGGLVAGGLGGAGVAHWREMRP